MAKSFTPSLDPSTKYSAEAREAYDAASVEKVLSTRPDIICIYFMVVCAGWMHVSTSALYPVPTVPSLFCFSKDVMYALCIAIDLAIISKGLICAYWPKIIVLLRLKGTRAEYASSLDPVQCLSRSFIEG